ncbi:MAG: hypothetical protein RR205_03260 [Oscillospiraceae bacterium]
MLASEMIATIKMVEKEHHGITRMYAGRINWFQRQELSETQGVVYDEAFLDFAREMENEIGGKINSPTAKKILNNWYIWAKENLDALSKIEPFKGADNAIDWLIKNNFRIDHVVFAKEASPEQIKQIQDLMPRDCELYQQLKAVADKKYRGERGFSYPYLVKVVAGFSKVWQ